MDINQILGFVIIVLSALNIRRMLRAREGEQNKGYLFLNSKAIIVNALLGGLIGLTLITKVFELL